jgi:peptidoglycan/xylan/chitin deacetylase (PgdA/CDA1 family)
MSIRRVLHSVVRRFSRPDPKPLILMYHRVATEPVDPWGLAVSPLNFQEQVEVLRRTRRPMPLRQFVDDFVGGSLAANAVAITFDDGYLDNLVAAKPILAAYDAPATVFFVTGQLDGPKEFWWDELGRLVLLASGSHTIELVIRGNAIRLSLDGDSGASSGWRAWSPPQSQRQEAFAQIWSICRSLEEEERGLVLAELRSRLDQADLPPATSRAMSRSEAQTLAHDGLVTIGAHTVVHPMLTRLSANRRKSEIIESKVACETLIGERVGGFAYPYGELDGDLEDMVCSAGFSYACSTKSNPVTSGARLTALPRYQVFDYHGDAFEQWLRSV